MPIYIKILNKFFNMRKLNPNTKFLLKTTSIRYIYFFSGIFHKLTVFGEAKNYCISSKKKKKIKFLRKLDNNHFSNYDYFLSFDLSLNEETKILQILKNFSTKKGLFFFSNQPCTKKFLESGENLRNKEILFYSKFFLKIIKNKKLKNQKKGLNSFYILKIIPRKIFPGTKLTKWGIFWKIYFSKKKVSFNSLESFFDNTFYFEEMKKGKTRQIKKKFFFFLQDLLQRSLDEIGLVVSSIRFWNYKYFLFVLNFLF